MGFKRIKFIYFAGDILIFYTALFATLALRYGRLAYLSDHIVAFSWIMLLWLFAFYAGRLYDAEFFRNNKDFFNSYFLAFAVAFFLAAIVFYVVPVFTIAPKTNLVIFGLLFVFFDFAWRYWLNRLIMIKGPPTNLVLLGAKETRQNLEIELASYDYLGLCLRDHWSERVEEKLKKNIAWGKDCVFVADPNFYTHQYAKIVFQQLGASARFISLENFYEEFFEKIPHFSISEFWILTSVTSRKPVFDFVKRIIDFIGALIAVIILSPFMFVIGVSIRIFLGSPVFFKQERVGEGGKTFTLVKFRTMKPSQDHEARWAPEEKNRIPVLGVLLRKIHADEFPQVWNILKGDMSFVGPRAEQAPLAEKMQTAVRFYDLRHLVKPGVTGWAQLKYKYGGSIEENRRKLEYDLYYVKNRSLAFDIVIFLKTARLLFWTGT